MLLRNDGTTNDFLGGNRRSNKTVLWVENRRFHLNAIGLRAESPFQRHSLLWSSTSVPSPDRITVGSVIFAVRIRKYAFNVLGVWMNGWMGDIPNVLHAMRTPNKKQMGNRNNSGSLTSFMTTIQIRSHPIAVGLFFRFSKPLAISGSRDSKGWSRSWRIGSPRLMENKEMSDSGSLMPTSGWAEGATWLLLCVNTQTCSPPRPIFDALLEL